jgi:hypothetical protein
MNSLGKEGKQDGLKLAALGLAAAGLWWTLRSEEPVTLKLPAVPVAKDPSDFDPKRITPSQIEIDIF